MQVMNRYKIKPDQLKQNAELLHAVYAELAEARPSGLRYATFQLDNEGSFVTFVEFEGEPGSAPHHRLASFQRYRATLDERCEEPPITTVLREFGSYGYH
jgi:quinol monooxygenase YgiN